MQNPLDADRASIRGQAHHISDVASAAIRQRAFGILLLAGRFSVLDQEQAHPSTSPLVNASSWRGVVTCARHRPGDPPHEVDPPAATSPSRQNGRQYRAAPDRMTPLRADRPIPGSRAFAGDDQRQ